MRPWQQRRAAEVDDLIAGRNGECRSDLLDHVAFDEDHGVGDDGRGFGIDKSGGFDSDARGRWRRRGRLSGQPSDDGKGEREWS
jgi:hypothetical protein